MKLKKVTSLLLALTLTVGMTMATGCGKKSEKKPTDDTNAGKGTVSTEIKYKKSDLALTIDKDKITMDDILFYIFISEGQVDYYDQMYQYYFNTSYWDMEIEEGKTVRDEAKEQAMDTIIRYEVLYREALKNNYTLDKKDEEQLKEEVKNAMSALTKEQLELTGFTEDKLTTVQTRLALADKYYKDIIDSFNIDKEEIKKDIDKEQYKEYQTKCIKIATTKVNKDGEEEKLSEEAKAGAKKKIDDVYTKIKSGTKMDTVLDKEETELVYIEDMSFLPNDEQETTDKKYMEAAMKLKVGETSEVIEGEKAYYIIEMVDNNSTKSYDEAVNEAIKEQENTRFDEEFEKIKAHYEVKVNNAVWDLVVMGNNTIVPQKADEKGNSNAAAGTTDGALDENTPLTTDDAKNE